jgi:hypothetical protein
MKTEERYQYEQNEARVYKDKGDLKSAVAMVHFAAIDYEKGGGTTWPEFCTAVRDMEAALAIWHTKQEKWFAQLDAETKARNAASINEVEGK